MSDPAGKSVNPMVGSTFPSVGGGLEGEDGNVETRIRLATAEFYQVRKRGDALTFLLRGKLIVDMQESARSSS